MSTISTSETSSPIKTAKTAGHIKSSVEAAHQRSYDVIVIGSGVGGLTCASLLGQVAGKRVLVLEKHFKLGGLTHAFRRKGYEWDPGVHYVGQMAPGCQSRKIMDLVTGGKIEWYKIGPYTERFQFPDLTFNVSNDRKQFQADLIAAFPKEERAIRDFFKELKAIWRWQARWFVSKTLPQPISTLLTWPGRKRALMTTKQALDQRFSDPRLKGILSGVWPSYGSLPHDSAFSIHGTVLQDFMNEGGYYPIGGAKLIAEHAAQKIEACGGSCLVSHGVQTIIVENNRAVGVRAEYKGQSIDFRAPIIISNAGAFTTFRKLVPIAAGVKERIQVQRCQVGVSCLTLFLGLNDDPRNHGFDEANYWLFDNFDSTQHRHQNFSEIEDLEGMFLSFGSLRNPGQTPHVAQLVTFSDMDRWQKFEGTQWHKRGQDYEAFKERLSEIMLKYVCRWHPQLRKIVEYHELSTPLSVESFTSHHQGMIYGQACTPDRLFENAWQVSTSVKNLYLTGCDVGIPGVNGALLAGAMTSAKVLGLTGFPRIFGAVDKAAAKMASG